MTERAKMIMRAYDEAEDWQDEPIGQDKKCLAAAIRAIVNEYQYYHFGEGEDMVVDARVLYELADELEAL